MMQGNALEKSVCMGMSCGLIFDGNVDKCPECGARALPQSSIRRRGWVAIACGIFLVGMMGAILWFTVPMLLDPGQEAGGTRFDGTPDDMLFMLAIFAMVIAVGIAALVAGVSQAIYGRRQRGAIKIALVVSVVLLGIGYLIRRGIII